MVGQALPQTADEKMKSEPYFYGTEIQCVKKRRGNLRAPGLPDLVASTPPEFKGEAGFWTPEHLFVAAAEFCLMATFPGIAGNSRLPVASYHSPSSRSSLPRNQGRGLAEVAIEAVDEVGNPTILATLTVIAAILPMAFVGGLMGPYMRPIPIGASAAMVFSLIVDMPEGTTLEETARVTGELAAVIRKQPEVTDLQTYVGAASPYNFNGLVRHYFLRRGPNVADIQVNLVGKSERSLQSHDIAKRVREQLDPAARRAGARIKVAEVPPGPRCSRRWSPRSTVPRRTARNDG